MLKSKISKFHLPLFITAVMFNCHMGDAYASVAVDDKQTGVPAASSSSSSSPSSSSAADNQQLPRPSFVTPTCDPLASEKIVTVYHQIKTPNKTILGLEPLYNMGLSGRRVRVGVIEFSAVPCDPPGLQGAIIGFPEKTQEAGSSHWLLVSQVIASQAPDGLGGYIGFAPNAQVIVGIANLFSEKKGYVVDGDGIEDAVKYAIREGAVCLNLSISSKYRKTYFYSEKHSVVKGNPNANFTVAIQLALNQSIPVFLSGGNDKELLGEDPFLTRLAEDFSYHPLLQIVFGWEPSDEVFDRNDVRFAKQSARGSAQHTNLLKYALSCPYTARVMHKSTNLSSIKSEEALKIADDKAYRDESIPFSLTDVSGTSFSAPALASIYALLHEYASRQKKLESQDIMACIRGTAYMPVLEGNQEHAWFGSGIPDGGKAARAMDDITNARLCFERKEFSKAVELWKRVITTLRDFSCPEHIAEALEACTQSSQDSTTFLKSIVGYWPSLYPNHLEDRLQSFSSFAKGEFDSCYEQFSTIREKTKNRRYETLEMGLITALNQRIRHYYIAVTKLEEHIKRWEDSFLSSEIATIPTTDQGEFFEKNGGRKLLEPYLTYIRKEGIEKIQASKTDKRFLRDIKFSLSSLSSMKFNRKIKLPQDLQKELEALLQHEEEIERLVSAS
ncbi:MAG: hypothetical protein NT128_00605 [Proteobacteria bacterium]|nr:hypothetical protein [Pseudomonadota bacterium]